MNELTFIVVWYSTILTGVITHQDHVEQQPYVVILHYPMELRVLEA